MRLATRPGTPNGMSFDARASRERLESLGERGERAVSSPRFAFAGMLLMLSCWLTACAGSVQVPAVTAGGEQRDARGLVFVEHHIAGLRVLETVVAGSGGARADVPFDARLPIVLSIHGRGDRARLPTGRFGGLDTPVRLLVPEAPDALGDGFTWSPVSVTENRTAVLAVALARNADRLASVLETLIAARAVVGRPIVTGFSQGGMLSYTLAVRHPGLVGAAVPVAGWIPLELLPQQMSGDVVLPIIDAVHGTADPIVRVGPTRRAVRRLRNLGFTVDLFEIEGVRHLYTDSLAAAVHERLARAVAAVSAATAVTTGSAVTTGAAPPCQVGVW